MEDQWMAKWSVIGHRDPCTHPLWEKWLKAIPFMFITQDFHDCAGRVDSMGIAVVGEVFTGMELIGPTSARVPAHERSRASAS